MHSVIVFGVWRVVWHRVAHAGIDGWVAIEPKSGVIWMVGRVHVHSVLGSHAGVVAARIHSRMVMVMGWIELSVGRVHAILGKVIPRERGMDTSVVSVGRVLGRMAVRLMPSGLSPPLMMRIGVAWASHTAPTRSSSHVVGNMKRRIVWVVASGVARRTRSVSVAFLFHADFHLRPRRRHGAQKLLVNLAAKQRTLNVSVLRQGTKAELGDQRAESGFGVGIRFGPSRKVLEAVHPFFGIKERDGCQVIRDRTDFFTKECSDGRDRHLDVDSIALELLDALG